MNSVDLLQTQDIPFLEGIMRKYFDNFIKYI